MIVLKEHLNIEELEKSQKRKLIIKLMIWDAVIMELEDGIYIEILKRIY